MSLLSLSSSFRHDEKILYSFTRGFVGQRFVVRSKSEERRPPESYSITIHSILNRFERLQRVAGRFVETLERCNNIVLAGGRGMNQKRDQSRLRIRNGREMMMDVVVSSIIDWLQRLRRTTGDVRRTE
jgi:hypothetical protein